MKKKQSKSEKFHKLSLQAQNVQGNFGIRPRGMKLYNSVVLTQKSFCGVTSISALFKPLMLNRIIRT